MRLYYNNDENDDVYVVVKMRVSMVNLWRWWEWWYLSMMMIRVVIDVLCACIRVVHFRGNLALVCGLCDECILVKLVDFNSMRPCRV